MNEGRTLLSVRSVSKTFGSSLILNQLSLEIGAGEFITILGESGSGKTTLLRLIAGFETVDSGEIWLGGVRIDHLPAHQRSVNTVFQQYALFPHLSVFENVAYGLRIQKVGTESVIRQRALDALALVKMSDFAKAAPRQLSGGQQQRVALARAIVNRPQLLLLDEPLSALDANLRHQMQAELSVLHKTLGIAFVFVTHDQAEAMVLSDRIALMRAGVLEQVATPEEIYHRPATAYAARFIGQTNLLDAPKQSLPQRWGSIGLPPGTQSGDTLSLRPERIRLVTDSSRLEEGYTRFRAIVVRQTFEGPTTVWEVSCGDDSHGLRVRLPSRVALAHAVQASQAEVDFEFLEKDLVPVQQGLTQG